MYSIYADGICIYDDTFDSPDYALSDPTLKLSDSAAGSLEFTMPTTHVRYGELVRMQTEVIVYRDNVEIWSGRVLKEDNDFWNNKKIFCEGELAYLNDSTQPQHEYHTTIRGFLTALINVHNGKVSADKQFTVGAVTVTDNNDSIYRYTNYEHTLDAINDKLVNRLGGHIRIRKVNGTRYIDYLADYPKVAEQKINFGENLLDFVKSFDMSHYATVILPRGAQLEESPIEALTAYLTVESVNGGSPYVKSDTAVGRYGWIEQIVDWEDVTDPSNLLRKAQQYLSSIQFDEMMLEVSALDLHYLDVNTDAFDLLDEISCVSEPHGLDKRFPLVEMDIPMAHPEDTKYKLGNVVHVSLTASSKAANQAIINRINQLPTRQSVLEEAKENATAIMNMATNGYVTTVIKDGHAEELIISDNPDYTQAQKLWRWNLNGFGYSKTGYEGQFGLAITMDGAIVADFITAGTLNADIIRAGIIQDKLGYNYWDLDTGEFSLSPNTTIGEGGTIQQIIEGAGSMAVEEAEAYTDAMAAAMQAQIDGAIVTYYENYEPKTTNYPANEWDTDSDKKKHEGDIFYWKDKGYAYRWMKNSSNQWEWQLIQDTDITAAIAKADAAQATANRKITTYAQQAKPTGSNLSVGDIWIDTKNKNLMYRWNGSSWINVRDQLVVDANNAASAAKKAADTAKADVTATKKLIETLEKEQGYNILRGTNDTISLTASGAWKLSLWRAASGGTGARTGLSIGSGPQMNIFRGWRLANANKDKSKIYCDIAQDGVEITAGKKYTLSCYAKGTGTLVLQYGATTWTSKAFGLNKVNAWTRYSWTFTADGAKKAGDKYLIHNGKTNIFFGNRALGSIDICGLMLELGSELHDYQTSSDEGAIKAIKESLTQQEVFNRLTNNGKVQGIKLSNGELYVNASYINTGTMSAKYLKAGVISDKKGLSSWNLETGIMNLKLEKLSITSGKFSWKSPKSSMTEAGLISCTGASINGTFKAGNYEGGSYVQVSGGTVGIYYKKTDLGFIGSNNFIKDDNYRGIVFDLNTAGSYMSWNYKMKSTDNYYTTVWTYAAKAKNEMKRNSLNAGCDVDLQNHYIRNIGNGQDLGRVLIPYQINNDGTVRRWYICTVKDGVIQG